MTTRTSTQLKLNYVKEAFPPLLRSSGCQLLPTLGCTAMPTLRIETAGASSRLVVSDPEDSELFVLDSPENSSFLYVGTEVGIDLIGNMPVVIVSYELNHGIHGHTDWQFLVDIENKNLLKITRGTKSQPNLSVNRTPKAPLWVPSLAIRRQLLPTLCVIDQVMASELTGFEFDWFAVDGNGNLALFATAGEGFLPGGVAAHSADYSALLDSLPAPRSGTSDVWNDYAVLGLFVFDWALPGGPYEKRASPVGAASRALEQSVLALPQLPRFCGSFPDVTKVSHWQ